MRHLLLTVFIFLLVMIDQASKLFIIRFWHEPIHINEWLTIVLVYNTGISFGFFQGHSEITRWILVALTMLITSFIIVLAYSTRNRLLRFAFALLTSGAIGNIIDRLSARGAVVDFIDFHVGDWHWPAFNVADSLIVCGAALIILDVFFSRSAKKNVSKL